MNRLRGGTRVRKIYTARYNTQVPALDDTTRIRTLKIYDRHTQENAIDFVDHAIRTFPFRIREIRTDSGHEFRLKFHWHVEDKGIRHAYIKPSSPHLNGKVERFHRPNSQEFYQLLTYTGDVDLKAKSIGWERFYKLARPHGAHTGKLHFEALSGELSSTKPVSRQIAQVTRR